MAAQATTSDMAEPNPDLDAEEKRRRSFERSLAGQSVGKAGVTRDQTEVNRIIAEASKGSKYYEMQVKKDRELTTKIAWFRSKRDELMTMAQQDRLEADADRIIMEVEATRDLSQTIVHVDMDAFYAAVEIQRDPSLKGKAFGVGGGVLCTASYEARKYGVRSAMAGFIARKLCPHIILTDLHFDLYGAASKKVREVLLQYDSNLMMAGLDEGYLNITSYMAEHGMSAWDVVSQLRADVEAKTGMTISAGIAANRMLAKICSDKNKPNGQFELEADRTVITRFMRDLPVRKIPGFGRVTERCLEGLGVEICGDIFDHRAELLVMNHWFGFRGLCKAYLGIASNTVSPHKREERKSVGVERTFRDKHRDEDILNELESIAEELEGDLRRLQYSGRTVTVKFKLHTYESKTRAFSVKKYISTKEEILPIALDLMRKELPVRVRLLGIRLTNLKDLTVPEKGVKTFFSAPGNASSSKVKQEDMVDLTHLEDDDDLEQVSREVKDESISLSRSATPDLDPSPRVDSDLANSHLVGPVCPICSRALGPGTSNSELNKHIDLCLNRDMFEGVGSDGHESEMRLARSSRSMSPRKRDREGQPIRDRVGSSAGRSTKKRKGAKVQSGSGSLLEWLKQSK